MIPKRFSQAAVVDPLAQVRRINKTWLVRGGLDEHAESYLVHLGESDPERLQLSCRMALGVLHSVMEVQDPKVLFYPGLFLLANESEVASFLDSHPYTRSAVLLARCQLAGLDASDLEVDVAPGDKLERVAATLVKTVYRVCPEGWKKPGALMPLEIG